MTTRSLTSPSLTSRSLTIGSSGLGLTALLVTVAVVATLEAQSALAETLISGVASVIDADTIEIHNRRIRLHGIDAPERAQACQTHDGETWRCGQSAALALQDKLGRGAVDCRATGTDRYGRLIGRCALGGENIGGWLVRNGWAVAYRRYATDFVPHEEAAKSAGLGIWSGGFVAPWDWRRGRRNPTARAKTDAGAPGRCEIKGNVGGKGTRIYHVPGGRWYDRTRINENEGERWFCSEADAQAAGWRRSSQ